MPGTILYSTVPGTILYSTVPGMSVWFITRPMFALIALGWHLMVPTALLLLDRWTLHYTILYCTVLHCTVLHCTVYCTVLYCTAPHGAHCSTTTGQVDTALQLSTYWMQYSGLSTAMHCTVLHCTALHYTALHCITLHCNFIRETVSLQTSDMGKKTASVLAH